MLQVLTKMAENMSKYLKYWAIEIDGAIRLRAFTNKGGKSSEVAGILRTNKMFVLAMANIKR